MRTSRLAKETSQFFAAAAPDAMATTPRRSTRLRIARFSYNDPATAAAAPAPDIEDVVGITPQAMSPASSTATTATTATATTAATVARKRKRATSPTIATDSTSAATLQATTAISTSVSTPSKVTPTPRRARKAARIVTAPDPATGAPVVVHAQPPLGWAEMYAVAKEMRTTGRAANAAVDTMGCERLALAGATARDRRFHTLVALMLSSQTKDTVNAEAMARLHAELPACAPGRAPGLTLDNVLAVEPEVLNGLIGKVGFHNNKTKYIKQAAVLLRDRHGSDIPDTIEGLMALPGVGPKMAHLCMSADNGWGRVEGIGVDVHVHRITNLWGWQRPATRTPEDTRRALEAWLPRDRWKEINWLLVGLGQAVCLPVGRRCGDCDLGLRGLCGAADRAKVGAARRRMAAEAEAEAEGKRTETRGLKKQEEDGGKGEGEGVKSEGSGRTEEKRESIEVEEKRESTASDSGEEMREGLEGLKVETAEEKAGVVKAEVIKKEEDEKMFVVVGAGNMAVKLEETDALAVGEVPCKKEEDAKP